MGTCLKSTARGHHDGSISLAKTRGRSMPHVRSRSAPRKHRSVLKRSRRRHVGPPVKQFQFHSQTGNAFSAPAKPTMYRSQSARPKRTKPILKTRTAEFPGWSARTDSSKRSRQKVHFKAELGVHIY